MIHFDFVVSDVEAEAIMEAVHEVIVQDMVRITNEMSSPTPNRNKIDQLKFQIEFTRRLKAKMTNRRL